MKEQEYRILHLEDMPTDAVLAEHEIRKVLDKYVVRVVENENDFIAELDAFKPHIVISDYSLPSFDGISALKIVLATEPLTPVIILTGSLNEDTAVFCLKAGATDYVLKSHIKRLGASILNALELKENKVNKQNAELALLQSEENFRRSISESSLGIRIITVDGITTYVNKAFLDIYEYSNLQEFKNIPIKNRYTAECYAQHQDRKVQRATGNDVTEYELSIIRKNGEIRHVKVMRSEILWDGIKHYQVINQDITEQKKLTADLIASKEKAEESDRLKTSFLHNISHEIRTPMNAIVGFSELLTTHDITPENRNQYTQIIIKSSDQLLSIITQIVNMSTIETGQEHLYEKTTSLNSILKLLYTQFYSEAARNNISLSYTIAFPDNDDFIRTDETKLIQIISNLLSNAFKFTKHGAVIFGYDLKGGFLEFYVKDSGIGVPHDMHKEIFERFRQVESSMERQFGGSGLGLSISKAYVELLGGTIGIISDPGEGSVFHFTIPYKKAFPHQVFHDEPALKPDAKPGEVKTILVADDEYLNFKLISIYLPKDNYILLRAATGIEAVEICKQNRQIDLVLMDLKMPEMDGYEATKLIRAFMPDIPIIALTAYSSDIDSNRAKTFGCNDFISKPFKKELLLAKIRQQLQSFS